MTQYRLRFVLEFVFANDLVNGYVWMPFELAAQDTLRNTSAMPQVANSSILEDTVGFVTQNGDQTGGISIGITFLARGHDCFPEFRVPNGLLWPTRNLSHGRQPELRSLYQRELIMIKLGAFRAADSPATACWASLVAFYTQGTDVGTLKHFLEYRHRDLRSTLNVIAEIHLK